MKNLTIILVLCLVVIGALVWSFRHKQGAQETTYSRNIIGEYINQNSKEIAFSPTTITVANGQLYVVSAEKNTVYIYDLGLHLKKTIHFPVLLRGLVNFSVQADTAYAVDGTQTMVAFNLTDSTYRVENLKRLRFSRFITLMNGSYLLKGPSQQPASKGREVFKVAKAGSGVVTMTHNVIKNLEDHGLNSDGFFIRSMDGTIYCVSYLNSNIYTFDREGSYINTLHTIGNANREYDVKLLGSSHTFGEPVMTLNITAAGADKLLYLYSRVKSPGKKKHPNDGYVDVYNLKDNYIGSLRMCKVSKRSFRCLAATGDSLIAVEGSQLVIYKKSNDASKNLSIQ